MKILEDRVGPPGPQGQPGKDGQTGPAGPGTALSFVASADLGGQRVVRVLPDGTIAYASADSLDDVGEVVGITMAAAAAGTSTLVSYAEVIDDPSWAWTPGPVFLGVGAALTQSPPTLPAAVFRQQVATALLPTRIVVGIALPLILA